MQLVDWITIGVILLSAIIGLFLGFGKLLKIFTGGLFGVIISIIITYFCIGVVSSWGFVQDLMARLIETMENANNGFVNFLLGIGIEKIILGVGLFIVIQIIRIIIINVIKSVFEIENPVIKGINRFAGMVTMLAVMCVFTLVAFHIVDLIGGSTEESFRNYITGAFRLEWLFDNNPLQNVIKRVTEGALV